MILRRRPLVFISSAISGLTELRERIAERLQAMALAEQWLFEIHATAAGEPAEAHYLDIARSCDVMVVIVGDRRTTGTEDEYHEAFRDNPDKILPFFLGDGSDEVNDFRDLLEQPDRHLRKKVANEDEMVDAVCDAIEQTVRTGRLITGSIRTGLAARLEALDRLIGLDPPRSYLPALAEGAGAATWSQAWPRLNPMAVVSPGGAGKTYGALVALHQLASVTRLPLRERPVNDKTALDIVIPLYLRATADEHTMPGMIARAFASARFFPGDDLAAQYAMEGRLAVVVDGHDDLVASAREELLRSVVEWQATYPRCRLAVLARGLSQAQLPNWHVVGSAPLSDAHVQEIFECEGQPLRGMHDVPAELKDIVIWPFWCAALARHGLAASSGLALLRLVISERLNKNAEALRAAKVRAGLGAIALETHPAVEVSVSDAVDILLRWQDSDGVRQRFDVEPAEALLEAIRHSGLVQAEGERIVFLHPLLASVLGAESAQAHPGDQRLRASPELAVFTAALLGDSQHEQLLDLLAHGDVFFAARVLRLSTPTARASEVEADLGRYQTALRSLASVAGPDVAQELPSIGAVAAQGDGWTALTHVPNTEGTVVASYEEVMAAAEAREVVVWEDGPFTTRLPEHLAVAEALLRFKRGFDELTRSEIEVKTPAPPAPANPDQLRQRVLAHVRAVAQAERDLRERAGLAGSPSLPTLDGEPHLEISSSHGGRWIEETWGHEKAEVTIRGEWDPKQAPWDGVAEFLDADAGDAARNRLRKTVEKEIGSNLGSASWNRPTALAGWVW
jgi:hypothetical protein